MTLPRAYCLGCKDWHPIGSFRAARHAGFDSAYCDGKVPDRTVSRLYGCRADVRHPDDWGPFPRPDWDEIARKIEDQAVKVKARLADRLAKGEETEQTPAGRAVEKIVRERANR